MFNPPKLFLVGLAFASLAFLNGCASVARGTKDTLVVETDPAGANVRLSTGQVGQTPTSFHIPRKHDLEVFIDKDGYEPLAVHVSAQISGAGAVGLAGNVLVGGVIGLGVDAITGASKDLKPNPIKVTMVPLKKEEKSGQASAPAATGAKVAEPAAASPEIVANSEQSGANAVSSPPFKPIGTQVGTVHLPTGMDSARVPDLISGVLLAREWEVKEQANDHVVGHIKHRSSEAVLTLVVDSGFIRMYCEGWKIDKASGAHISPELPNSWIENIRADLTERLARAPIVH